MDDLVAFVRARLDDDQQAAEDADPDDVHYSGISDALRAFHDHHTPARVLADVEAKRRIIIDYEYDVRNYKSGYTNRLPRHRTLKYLALPYADHPDYREDWRP